jgi:hypothetical protein
MTGTHSGAGEHQVAPNYQEGDVIESDLDLIKMFPNKFEKADKPTTTKGKKVKKEEEVPAEESEEPEEEIVEEGPGTEFGAEVSDHFQSVEKGLRVFRNENGYTVVDADDPTAALHAHPFRNQKEVRKFVEKNALK